MAPSSQELEPPQIPGRFSTPSRPFLDESAWLLEAGDYLGSLIATRKAFFLDFERDYCIYSFRGTEPSARFSGGLLGLLGGGWKAGSWTHNSQWISENVETPFDYVQINHETWRVDAMEWGINTQTLNNIRRLTPEAVQLERNGEWLLRRPAGYEANSATREHAAYCLDLTIEVVRRKHDHIRAARTPSEDKAYDTPPAYVGQPLLRSPAREGNVLRVLAEDDRYEVEEILSGFDPTTTFYRIRCTPAAGKSLHGYVEKIEAQGLDEPESAQASGEVGTP